MPIIVLFLLSSLGLAETQLDSIKKDFDLICSTHKEQLMRAKQEKIAAPIAAVNEANKLNKELETQSGKDAFRNYATADRDLKRSVVERDAKTSGLLKWNCPELAIPFPSN